MKPLRRLVPLLCAVSLVAAAEPGFARPEDPSAHREPPREKIEVKELVRLAAERTDRVAVGWSSKQAVGAAALSWASLGPAPILFEYWSGNANAAGRVSCVAPHPTDPNTIYIAAAQGGVWKTTNGGTTWTPLTDQLSSLSSGWITLHPTNPNILYYGTGEQHYSGDSFYGDGLFRSVDGGAIWTKIASTGQVGSYIARVLVDPANPSRLFVASDRGVVRSVDGGVNWSLVWSGTVDQWCNDLVFDPASSAVMYAGIYDLGVLKSVDSGTSWSLLAGGLPASSTFYRVNLAIAPSNGQVLYASFVDLNENLLGLYRTANGGTAWSLLGSTPNYLVGQGSYDNCMVVQPTNPNVFYAGGVFPYDPETDGGVIKTVDGGATWDDISIANDGSQVHPDQHSMAFGADGALWLANDGGVWKTTNGGQSWINRNTNLSITQFYKFGLHPQDSNQIIAGTQDNGTLIYQGLPGWPQLLGGDGGPCGYDPYDPSYAFSTYIFMWYLYRWIDYVYDADVTGPWQGLGDRASFGNGPLVFDPNVAGSVLAGTYRVWRSLDRGDNWSAISGDLTDGGVLRAIAVVAGVPGTYYASSTDGVVHFTSDDGLNWSRRSTGLPVAFLPDVVVRPNDPLSAYTCARGASGPRVFKTLNSGVAWADITGDLPANVSPHSLAVDFRVNPAKLYLGADYGVWTSTDGGVHWIKDSSGLPNCAVFDLQIDPVNDVILAGTHGRGMWRAPLGVGSVAVAAGAAIQPTLHRVAPNPTRLPAIIGFDLPRASRVSLEIFDLSGRRLRTLETGFREAGRHQVVWDGDDGGGRRVPGGVYLYRLEVDGHAATRRMVVLR